MFIKKDNASNIKEVIERNHDVPIEEFIKDSHFPFLKNLKEAVSLIRSYIEGCQSEQTAPLISIIGDYDVDGICATTILYWAFERLGIKATTRLPHRFSEGYGLNTKIIDEIDRGLLITVDNGIAAFDAVKKARDKGLIVLVVDHHLPPVDQDNNPIILDADLILDPHIENESSFKYYCGAGLAYRIARELHPDKKLIDLMVLAAIATVADVMPLYGANRTIVKEGLEAINKRRCVPGLKSLLSKLQMDNHITEDDFGFKLGPICNASGRLYDNGAERVLELLKCANDDYRMPWKSDALIKTNEKRKEVVKESMKVALDMIGDKRPIVIYDESFGEGIIGIIAGQIAEKYHCPAIVFTKTEKKGVIKGSGRSIPEIHLKNALDKIKDTIIGYGGHAGAAGLSIKQSDLYKFTESFATSCGNIPALPEDIYYDLELNERDVENTLEELKKYSPYGEGNPRPVFHALFTVDQSTFRIVGDGTHFMINDCKYQIKIMGFGMTEEYREKGCPTLLDCVGYLSESWYNNKRTICFELLKFL